MTRQGPHPASRGPASVLCFLLFLFCLRVVGQALAAFAGVDWLPPMKAWQSGLLPYPWLLLSQVVIVVVFAKVCLDFARGDGFFVRPRRGLAPVVRPKRMVPIRLDKSPHKIQMLVGRFT